eukprot:TRINITY_DN7697_c0_g1_i1.p1 TRINITY_DN7697_c0_g1~~TRINITY_DN7697_c0_g1_i1.p1  ORF type:complete len:314 (+),score=106.19 TRINITY_DN7697_c0_g1_i1:43-942(+)
MQARRLIVNADDLGYCAERDAGIMRCWRDCGVVAQVSVMPNAPHAAEAARAAAAAGVPLGLHLNLTEGAPVCAAAAVPTLCTPGGQLRGKLGFARAAQRGELAASDLARECIAQIGWFARTLGKSPQHVDAHQHAHVMPGVAQALAPVLNRAGVRSVRMPRDFFFCLRAAACAPPVVREVRTPDDFYALVVAQACGEAAEVFAAAGLATTTHFAGITLMGAKCGGPRGMVAALAELAAAMPPGATAELMVHPGDPQTDGLGDDFSRSADRALERDVWLSADVKAAIAALGLQTCSWDAL